MKRNENAFERAHVRAAWRMLAPALIVLACVAGWPLARTIWFGFTDANLSDLSGYRFIGFENYLAHRDGAWSGLLADPSWWRAVRNTLYFAIVSVSLEAALGLVFALVLSKPFPGRAIVQAAVLIPWAVPTVVSAKMWGWMLHDQFGVVNDLLLRLGLIHAPLAWTASSELAMLSVILVDVWKTTPFVMLLLLAALQSLPSDIYEAARVDGASALSAFFRITLPLIRPALVVAIAFRALDALRVFDLIYVLTSNSADTMSMSVFARQHLVEFQDVGYGSAAATLVFLTVALCVVVYLYYGRLRLHEQP
jgi:trehalose/maltose transport system permease protein